MKDYAKRNYGRELQSILAQTSTTNPSRSLPMARQENLSGKKSTLIPSIFTADKIQKKYGKTSTAITSSSSENLTRVQAELAARRFSKHVFKDPHVMSSTHFELSKSRKYRTMSESHDVRKMSPTLPRSKIPIKKQTVSVAFDDNNNRIEEIYTSNTKSPPLARGHDELQVTNENESEVLRFERDFVKRLKPILKSPKPTQKLSGMFMNRNKVAPQELLVAGRNVSKGPGRGRGFNYIARNASEIGLDQMRETAIDSDKLDHFAKCLKIIARLLMASGVCLLIFIVTLTMNSAFFDFMRSYLLKSQITFIFFLGTTMHSIVIGIYCLFTLSKLSHIRPYFLRVPFTLIFPLGFLVTSIQYFNDISEQMEQYLTQKMINYRTNTESRFIWDKLQDLLSCCGVNSSKEWVSILNSTTVSGRPPKSCCPTDADISCPDFNLPNDLHSKGCLTSTTHVNLAVAGFMASVAVVQLSLLTLSIYFMWKLFNLIKFEMVDTRSSWKIIFGKCYSICESEEYDRQQQLADEGQLRFQDFVRALPTKSTKTVSSNSDELISLNQERG